MSESFKQCSRKNSQLKSSHPNQYLPNFPTQPVTGISKHKTILWSSPSLEIWNTSTPLPPPPPPSLQCKESQFYSLPFKHAIACIKLSPKVHWTCLKIFFGQEVIYFYLIHNSTIHQLITFINLFNKSLRAIFLTYFYCFYLKIVQITQHLVCHEM